MCAAVVCPPIRELHHYNPTFKVEVCLYQPLWPVNDVIYDVTSLCSQLEILCAREINQAKKENRHASKLSESFCDKAQIVADQLHALSPRLPGNDLLRYLTTSSIGQLYPRATQYLTDPDKLPTDINWTPMEDHTEALSALHRLHGLANQIHHDMKTLSNHKYIAHQLALLHQSLASVSQVAHMSELKQNVETNFPKIKQTIGELQDQNQTPCLPAEQKQWLLDLTDELLHVCRNPPPEILECLQPAAQVLRSSLS